MALHQTLDFFNAIKIIIIINILFYHGHRIDGITNVEAFEKYKMGPSNKSGLHVCRST